MLMNPANFLTPFAHVARRLNIAGNNPSFDTFFATSYLVEIVIKVLAISPYASLRDRSNKSAYRFASLVRGDGLETWNIHSLKDF